jgi:S1-C subfamily serine protease
MYGLTNPPAFRGFDYTRTVFVDACEEASKFTRPVVISGLRLDGRIQNNLASFIVINDEGWVATAGHVVNFFRDAGKDAAKVAEYDKKVLEIDASNASAAKKHNEKIKMVRDNAWIRQRSMWWSNDQAKAVEAHVYPDADLALCRLDPFDPAMVSGYPTFKDPGDLKQGMGLVKVGFPFYEVGTTFDGTNFVFNPGTLPIPYFPMEGIFTRIHDNGVSADGYPVKLVETSSPGLRGQSGGPILDRSGNVCAIQSQTRSMHLGFKPKIQDGSKEVEEHQFLNVGLGVHPETIKALFQKHGITASWTT